MQISQKIVELSICHYNIIYGTLNFSIPLPPLCFREICNFENVDIEYIRKSILNFDWQRAFCNQNVNEKHKNFIRNLVKYIS